MRLNNRERDSDPPVDELLQVLSDSHRRELVRVLDEEQVVPLDDVAETLGEGESSQVVVTSLHHNHLPKMENCGVVEYDFPAREIRRGSRFDDALDVLRRVLKVE